LFSPVKTRILLKQTKLPMNQFIETMLSTKVILRQPVIPVASALQTAGKPCAGNNRSWTGNNCGRIKSINLILASVSSFSFLAWVVALP
jgi:hypothetical protein